ncbi:hypothetical protein ACF1AY_22900 [Streptomyces sp. NPDC014776]|uniref:hypothetical protein n=1 Tax=Streptomyces sp. NPDC014776 TaxID=3364909 RepID=UPI0037032844
MITAPQHAVSDSVYDAIRAAVIQMIRAGEIRSDSSAGPVSFVLHNVAAESRARELAAALHGNLAPLARASPRTASSTPSTDAHPETPCDLQIPVVRRQGGPPVHTPCDVFR